MKTPNALLRLFPAAAVAAALALPAAAQVDLSKIEWIGDSEGAGFSAGCLTKRVQVDSPGAIIARANSVTYQQPIIGDPGQGGCMVLTSLAPSFGKEPSTGVPQNLAYPGPYNNLSVGGCDIHDMVYATTGSEASAGTCRAFIDLVLRNASLKLGSMVDQAVAAGPTFVFLEDVGNDYLGAVLSGTAIDGVTVRPTADVAADYAAGLAKLKARQPNGVVFGPADVTSIPFTTTLPPYVTSGGKLVLVNGQPIPLLGPKGCPTGVPACPIPSTTIVTLNAAAYLPSGYGIPCAVAPLPKCNNPLPDSIDAAGNPGVLLYLDEITLLKTRFAEYTAAIKAATAAAGYKYFDTNALLLTFCKDGPALGCKVGYDFGGANISSAFLSGGAFSYDGFHLTPIGYAIWADQIVKFINANFPNANVKEPDLSTYLLQGGTMGGLSGQTFPYVWSPLTDAEKAMAIEGIFTPEFARTLASYIGMRRGVATPAPGAPARRVDRSAHADPQP